jgi:hypothetical protein
VPTICRQISAGTSLTSNSHYHQAVGGLLLECADGLNVKAVLPKTVFRFKRYRVIPTIDLRLLRICEYPTQPGHFLVRPNDAMSVSDYLRVLQAGLTMDETVLEVEEKVLDAWRSKSVLFRPQREDVEQVFGKWFGGGDEKEEEEGTLA